MTAVTTPFPTRALPATPRPAAATRPMLAATRELLAGTDVALLLGIEVDRRPWIDPQVVALSIQRADGQWHYCPWLAAGRDDLYDER